MQEDLWHDIVTPERAAKGDLDCRRHEATGFIRHAEVRDRSALAFLVERGILDPHHAYYAMVFEDMHRAFLRRVGHKSNSLYACEFFGPDLSDGAFESLYLRVVRELSNRSCRAEGRIRHAITTFIPALLWDARKSDTGLRQERDRLLYWKQPGKPAPFGPDEYRIAFDALVDTIDTVREQA